MKTPSKGQVTKFMSRLLLVLLAVIVCISLSCVYFLKRGIRLDEVTIGPITISDLSLVWQDKLELEVARLSLLQLESKTKPNGFTTPVAKIYSAARAVATLFSKLIIDEIQASGMTGTLYLIKDPAEKSYLHISSNDLALQSDIVFNQDGIVIDITEASINQFNTTASGKLFFDPHSATITGDISVNISESLPVAIQFTADQHQISYEGKEAGEISKIAPLVNLFGLDHNIQRWITDYLQGSRYNLKGFSGSGKWKDPITFLNNLRAEVRVDDCEYTFAPGLEPIKTKYTDVSFSNGVLTIKPHDSFFYGQSCEDSWLDINFTTPSDIVLTARITTHAAANKDIHALLEYYKLTLPFIQTEGKTEVDLTLAIHLNDIQISADGTFQIDKGVLNYNTIDLNVSGTLVTLKNSDITIEKAIVSYQDHLAVNVSGQINAGQGAGIVDMEIEKANLPIGKSTLTIDQSHPRPRLTYHLQNNKQWVDAKASSWMLDATKIRFGAFTSPFLLDLSFNLPPILVTIPPGVSAHVSGYVSMPEKKIDLQCDLFQYKVKDLVMESPNTPVAIHFDKILTIRHQKTSEWRLNNVPTTLYPSEFTYSNNVVKIVDGRLRYSSFFESQLTGHFDHKLKNGSFFLQDLDIKKPFLSQQLGLNKGLKVDVNSKAEGLLIDFPELDLRINTNAEGNWSATFGDLGSLHDRSPLLKQYDVDTGSLTISSKNGKMPYTFSADIPYQYPVLVKDDKPVDLFRIRGEVTGQGVTASVNEDLQFNYNDQLTINLKDIDFNVPAIIDLAKKHSSRHRQPASTERPTLHYSMKAVNSNLYFSPKSELLADSIHLDSADGKTTMKLLHGSGGIDLEIEGDTFSCKGSDLNDVFMSGLVLNGAFQGGSMSIAAMGSFEHFSVLIKMKETILKNFKTLNNMMAFINTIPALITFSRPNFSTEGLPVSSVVVGMQVDNSVATVKSLAMESSALSLNGAGSVDFSQKKIDMEMNLISSAKTSINKIPLVGFVLVGDEKKPSITMKITGDLMNPEVTNSMYRDIAKTPFSMLYRTLKLPSRLIESMDESTKVNKNKQQETEDQ